MKTLFIMRHAKSNWDDAKLADLERPLNERGMRTAPIMGKFMRERGIEPSIIISSPAVRAKETAELVKEAANFSTDLKFDERIYEASARTLLQVVSEIDDTCRTAMLVGHNPGIEGSIRLLTGDMEPMRTAALAVIELNIDSWYETVDGCGRSEGVFRPKDLTFL